MSLYRDLLGENNARSFDDDDTVNIQDYNDKNDIPKIFLSQKIFYNYKYVLDKFFERKFFVTGWDLTT